MSSEQSKSLNPQGCCKCLCMRVIFRTLLWGITLFLVLFSYVIYFNQMRLFTPIKSQSKQLSASPLLSEIADKFQQKRINCSAIFAGDRRETKRAVTVAQILAENENPNKYRIKMLRRFRLANNSSYVNTLQEEVKKWSSEFKSISEDWYLNATKNCEGFKWTRGYITTSLTKEEADFPIAFSIVAYKKVEMIERLLRVIYRPQNFYCIHVDKKSSFKLHKAVKAVADCFPDNIRMSSLRVNVTWGSFSVLKAELVCMKDLTEIDNIQHGRFSNKTQISPSKQWKYFINLTGQEFPLRTNYELVKILKAYKGANNQEGTRLRVKKRWWKKSPPHGIIPTRGAVHTVLNRATVDFILHDQVSKDFIKWLKWTRIPDETLFASLNFNPHLKIPGTYNGSNLENVRSFTRYKIWKEMNQCPSNHIKRNVCILSTVDMKRMVNQPSMFANKFYLQEDRVVIGCLEERLYNNTRDEYMGRKSFNTNFYENQEFVLHQVPAM